MKLTPLDIHHKEFRHSVKGYNEQEVDDFLDEVADEFERVFKENIDLSEKLEAANDRVSTYQQIERTLQSTLLQAQRTADEIIEKSRVEAADRIRDAELKAKELIHHALSQKQGVGTELGRLKSAEEEFRTAFRALLEKYLATLAEVKLPEDVRVMAGVTAEGIVGDAEVAQPGAEAKPAADAPVAAAAAPELEPPAPGFVTGVQLGETGSAAPVPIDDDAGIDAPEFKLPRRTAGERENDIDIEEID
ncbi:MAG: DivIVA domain-containing protein [Actinobacteria bacterium]|nr:MAG: DivIVA domain-containing protein [Actinomycetota bacterium]